MQVNSFQDLTVWKKAHSLVLEIYKLTKAFPDEERFGLISQIRRSSGSICANLAEGYTKSTNDLMNCLASLMKSAGCYMDSEENYDS